MILNGIIILCEIYFGWLSIENERNLNFVLGGLKPSKPCSNSANVGIV